MKRWKSSIKVIILSIVLCIFIHVIYVFISIYLYGNKNELVKADTAIVLGAAVYDDQPSPVFLERINHGIWLYQEGYVDKLIFTGGRSEEDRLSEAAAARAVAISKNVPAADIYIEERSIITEENLKNAKQLMEENNLSSAILVSDPLHMKRAMLIGRDMGLTLYSSPTPTTRYISAKEKFPFLCREVYFYLGYEVVSVFR